MNGKENPAYLEDGAPPPRSGQEKPKKHDPYALTDDTDFDENPWSDKSTKEKITTVLISITKFVFVLAFLYLFICALGLMGSAFQVLAGKAAGDIFAQNKIMANPVTGLIIGILVTVLVQSSSTSTSIFITMTAANLISVQSGIPLIMGANIGTSVTNTIVSLTQSTNREEFRKAFAGATVHDIFNLLSVLILLPVELITGYLRRLTHAIVYSGSITTRSKPPDMLKVITKPLTSKIISVNKTVITKIAEKEYLEPDSSMVKMWCKRDKALLERLFNESYYIATNQSVESNVTTFNKTTMYKKEVLKNVTVNVGIDKCTTDDFLFANTGMSDPAVGAILLIVSLIAMCLCLTGMVKLLTSLLKGNLARIIKKVINTDFPKPFGWVTGYLAILVGAGLTFLVQSSSVFTSSITPLVGIGVISLDRMFPLTLGSNIGTTTTGLLAALASDGKLYEALQLALCHFFFNITGIIIWYPIPIVRNVPINAAKALGNKTAKHRWFALAYLFVVFFLIPAALFGLSIAHEWALWSVLIVIAIILIPVVIISCLQSKKPEVLSPKLRSWDFLPEPLHSLKPYDSWCNRFTSACSCCSKAKKAFRRQSSSNNDVKEIRGGTNSHPNSAFVEDYAKETSKV